jgi:hypothetical protein
MRWGAALAFVMTGTFSAHAFTCSDVRALSAEQRAYYIKVFNITPAQQDRIRHACTGQNDGAPLHASPASVKVLPHPAGTPHSN